MGIIKNNNLSILFIIQINNITDKIKRLKYYLLLL